MKRSAAVNSLATKLFADNLTQNIDNRAAHDVLLFMENSGLVTPPAAPAKNFVGKDFKWGAMCTMRCTCQECDPEFPVHKWEPENAPAGT